MYSISKVSGSSKSFAPSNDLSNGNTSPGSDALRPDRDKHESDEAGTSDCSCHTKSI